MTVQRPLRSIVRQCDRKAAALGPAERADIASGLAATLAWLEGTSEVW
jgi:hypothetical protein